ncbi:MAG: hypothetical protein MRJ65_05665 [Candidatus Brocadiaceae bacterium]|nr:hypothetical protein [Candidatus Brocadiaceae bacterium]
MKIKYFNDTEIVLLEFTETQVKNIEKYQKIYICIDIGESTVSVAQRPSWKPENSWHVK